MHAPVDKDPAEVGVCPSHVFLKVILQRQFEASRQEFAGGIEIEPMADAPHVVESMGDDVMTAQLGGKLDCRLAKAQRLLDPISEYCQLRLVGQSQCQFWTGRFLRKPLDGRRGATIASRVRSTSPTAPDHASHEVRSFFAR